MSLVISMIPCYVGLCWARLDVGDNEYGNLITKKLIRRRMQLENDALGVVEWGSHPSNLFGNAGLVLLWSI